jgi:hypothetical protein
MQIGMYAVPIVATIVYALGNYLSSTKLEPFDWYKFGATFIVAIFIGTIMAESGTEITAASVGMQIAAYAGMVGLAETYMKLIVRRVKDYFKVA